jgi:surfeit locus 1 family protein
MLAQLRQLGLVWVSACTVGGVCLLFGLGTWQIQRKSSKERLIAELEERRYAEPITIDRAQQLWAERGAMEYLRVSVAGRFLHDKEMFLWAPQPFGPAWHVYTPLVTTGGTIVLVNRGLIPEGLKSAERRKAGQVVGEVSVTGLARGITNKGWFTPDNDPVRNIWFWRDDKAMLRAAFAGSEPPHVPFFLEAEATPANPGGWPKGGVTNINLPNHHLQYALTWYGLAIALIGVYFAFVRGRLRANPTACQL